MSASRHSVSVFALALAGSIVCSTVASAQPLDRTPRRYHILARTRALLKDYHLQRDGSTCNIGINNPGGDLQTSPRFVMDVGQVVSDLCIGAGGQVPQCFCNTPEQFDATCSTWTPPVLADTSDATFIAACDAAMGGGDFPPAFTFGTQNVSCNRNTDCIPLSADTTPGNGRCDLAPGAWGELEPKAGCILVLAGTYNVADFRGEKRVRYEIPQATTLNIAGEAHAAAFGDGSELINSCGNFRVNYKGSATADERAVNLGRNNRGLFIMDMCAPFAVLRLRSSNTLQGHFFADEVRSDFNNTGICCARGACGCFDDVTPTTVAVGGTLTLRDGCNLSNIEEVKVCGVDCPIDEPRPAGVITCTVPSVPGPLPTTCTVEGVSGSGTFRSNTTIQVTP